MSPILSRLAALALPAWLACACGGDGASSGNGGDNCASIPAPPTVDCGQAECAEIAIVGDAPATSAGTFRGFADPALSRDPSVPNRVWLAYSWPHVVTGADPQGNPIQLAAVQNRLARSDDDGNSFSYAGVLWPDVAADDPEGGDEHSVISSEVASLTTITRDGTVTWYGSHLRYFLEPSTGYHPRFATSWHVRIGAASSPQDLASAPETVLGLSTTAAAYQPAVRLDTLAGLPIQRCAIVNNPALATRQNTLYLIVECLAFKGSTPDHENSSIQVFATEPQGEPRSWVWRHAGRLADHDTARELGGDALLSPNVSFAQDGSTLLLLTPAVTDAASPVGTTGQGCVALQLDSFEPPRLARSCDGTLVRRARVAGTRYGACARVTDGAVGITATGQGAEGGNWSLRASRLDP